MSDQPDKIDNERVAAFVGRYEMWISRAQYDKIGAATLRALANDTEAIIHIVEPGGMVTHDQPR